MSLPTPIVMKGYAIYNPNTGLWSRGGNPPSWSKNPKIWSNIGHIKSHLSMCIVDEYSYGLRNAGIVKLRKLYKGCMLLDVTTNTEALDIYRYAREVAERKIAESNYLRGRRVEEEN